MAPWILFLLLLPLILIFQLQKNLKTKDITRKPPGPPGLPLIGNLHQFDGAKPHEFLNKLSKKYGPLMSLKLGTIPVVVISSAKIAKEALKTHDLLFSGRPSRRAANLKYSYNGLDIAFSPYDEYWREMRKISVLHLFSLKRVQSFRPILEDEVSLLVNEISDLSSNSNVINLSSLAVNLTNTLICRIAFGKKYGKEDQEKKRFDEIIDECEAMLAGFFISDYFPKLSLLDKLTGMFARLERNFRDLDLLLEGLIEDHLNPDRPDTMNDDVLDLLIQIKNQQSLSFDLTWDRIKAIIMNIFVAGTGTSAALIVWSMMALIQTPPAMKKVQTEIRDVIGKNGTITEEILHKLPYLDAIIKETIRLYPPTPVLIPRETTGNCKIGGYDIEAKSLVFINAWAIARDPETWEDPETFSPERFINSSIDVKGNNFELIPFGAGRRICPGATLGLTNIKFSLASLLYSFNWELPLGMKIEDIDTDISPGITMHKKNPLYLVAKKST